MCKLGVMNFMSQHYSELSKEQPLHHEEYFIQTASAPVFGKVNLCNRFFPWIMWKPSINRQVDQCEARKFLNAWCDL